MKKYLLCLFALVTTCVLLAQEVDSLSADTTVSDTLEIQPPKHTLGLYGLFEVMFPPNPGGTNITAGLGVGIKWDRLEGGFVFAQFQGGIERQLIFPNQFNLTYGHGGGFISYSLKTSKKFDFGALASFNRGDVIWERTPSGEDFLRDTFNLWRVGINIESLSLKYLRPELSLGYQKMSKIVLAGVNESDFTGLFIGFTVKVGYFNQ